VVFVDWTVNRTGVTDVGVVVAGGVLRVEVAVLVVILGAYWFPLLVVSI
jgi:hypothetical protein